MDKVKMGIHYEPKLLERMQNGWYSEKNPKLDNHGIALQSCLLGTGEARLWKTKLAVCAACAAVTLYMAWCYGVFA